MARKHLKWDELKYATQYKCYRSSDPRVPEGWLPDPVLTLKGGNRIRDYVYRTKKNKPIQPIQPIQPKLVIQEPVDDIKTKVVLINLRHYRKKIQEKLNE